MKNKVGKVVAILGIIFVILLFMGGILADYISKNNFARVSCSIDNLSGKELKKISKNLGVNLIGDFDVFGIMSCPLCDKTRVILSDVKNYENVLKDNLRMNIENMNEKIKEEVTYSNKKLIRTDVFNKIELQNIDETNIFILEGTQEVKENYLIYEKQHIDGKSLTRLLVGFDRKEIKGGIHNDCTSDKK